MWKLLKLIKQKTPRKTDTMKTDLRKKIFEYVYQR